MPWGEWQVEELDLGYMENWLLEAEHESQEHQLSKMILERLNYNDAQPTPNTCEGPVAPDAPTARNAFDALDAHTALVPPCLQHRVCLLLLRVAQKHLSALWDLADAPPRKQVGASAFAARAPSLHIGYHLVCLLSLS